MLKHLLTQYQYHADRIQQLSALPLGEALRAIPSDDARWVMSKFLSPPAAAEWACRAADRAASYAYHAGSSAARDNADQADRARDNAIDAVAASATAATRATKARVDRAYAVSASAREAASYAHCAAIASSTVDKDRENAKQLADFLELFT